MGLFSIFKKKTEQEAIIVPSDSIKALADGILFENEDIFLKWGSDIEAGKRYAKKEYRADRTIYQWGELFILNGPKATPEEPFVGTISNMGISKSRLSR